MELEAYNTDWASTSVVQGLFFSVLGRNDPQEESLNGDSKLKIVEVEQSGLPTLEQTVMLNRSTLFTTCRPRRLVQAQLMVP